MLTTTTVITKMITVAIYLMRVKWTDANIVELFLFILVFLFQK